MGEPTKHECSSKPEGVGINVFDSGVVVQATFVDALDGPALASMYSNVMLAGINYCPYCGRS